MTRSILYSLCFSICVVSLQAQIPPPILEEAPETIFQTTIGDAEVDLKLDGHWEASIRSSIGAAWIPGTGLQFPFVFPGFPDGFVYEQKPNLTLALWLFDRYFFETTFQDQRAFNTYVLGYQGKEGEVLQSIRAGNAGIEISPFPYLDFPGGSRYSPGIAARLQTPNAQHEFLLRFDPSLPVKKTYLGMNTVEENRIDPSLYITGRYFILPDQGVDFIEVFLEDQRGTILGTDGRKYRRATTADVSFSLADGLVSLHRPHPGRVLVYYEKNGIPVGSPSLGRRALPVFIRRGPTSPWLVDPLQEGEDFSWHRGPYLDEPIDRFRVPKGGKDFLLLYEPGVFSPFQDNGAYSVQDIPIPTGANTRVRVVKRGSASPIIPAYPVEPNLVPHESIIRMALVDGDRRDFRARFPFAEEAALLYGPNSKKGGGGADFELFIQSFTPVQSFTVPPEVIPGSVRIFRNGREERMFAVDYERGIITLPFVVSASDRIEIYFRTITGAGAGGDVLFGMGSTIQLQENLHSKVALGVRWNVLEGNFSTDPTDHPGIVGLSSQLTYQGENLRLITDGAAVYFNPDTTGLLRLLGMDAYDLTLEINKNNAFPSSIPAPEFFHGMLSKENRGKLFFKNFETVDLIGGTILNPYTWDPPALAEFPYQHGSLPGPYTASAPAEGFDRVLVLEYEMSATEQWVGAQMNLNTGFDPALDLSDVSAIRFAYKVVSTDERPVSLDIQIGALGEDLDGDGVMDEEISASSRGFLFNHGTLTLFVGAGQQGLGNNIKESEDANRNGILERENPALVFPGPTSTEGRFAIDSSIRGVWRTALLRVPYTERNRLKAVRALRFIVRKEGLGGSRGKILIGPVVFEGTTLPHRVEGPGKLEVREIYESLADIPAPQALHKVDPDRIAIFHPEGRNQKVLEVKWSNLGTAASDRWVLSAPTTEVPAAQYQEVNLYLRTAALGGAIGRPTYTLRYTDAQGKGATVVIPALAENRWEKLTIDLSRRRAYLGERELEVTVDSDFGKLNRFQISGTGATEGVLYIDELHLSNPRAAWGFAGSLSASYLIPGTILQLGDQPVLQNLSISQKIAARTETFRGRIDEESPSTFSSTTEGAVDVLEFVHTEGTFTWEHLPNRIQYEAGHRVKVQPLGGLLSLQDQFKRSFQRETDSLSRMNRIEINLGPPLSLGGGSEALFDSEILTQSWNTFFFTRPIPDFSMRGTLRLSHAAQGYQILEEPYQVSWIRAYHLLEPYTAGYSIRREGLLQGEILFDGEPVGVRLFPELSYVNTGEIDGQQRTSEKILIEIPLRLRRDVHDPGVHWILSYLRQGTSLRAAPPNGNYLSDFTTVQESLIDQTYFYGSIPFYELLVPGRWSTFTVDTAGLSFAEYISRASLSFSRPFGSFWQDLILPAQGEFSLKKTQQRSKDTVSTTNQFDITLFNSALNLFGALGAYPATTLWSTDEYQLKNSASFFWTEEEESQGFKISSQQKVILLGDQESKATLEHKIYLEQNPEFFYWGSLGFAYTWKGAIERDFGLSSLRKARDLGAFYLHTHKIEYRYENKEGWKNYLVLGHETALTFPGYGFLKLELNLGFGFETDYSGLPPGYRVLLGLSGGIFAHFTF